MGFLSTINPFSSSNEDTTEKVDNTEEVEVEPDQEDEDEEQFACDECGKEFNTKAGANIHAGQVHKDEEE